MWKAVTCIAVANNHWELKTKLKCRTNRLFNVKWISENAWFCWKKKSYFTAINRRLQDICILMYKVKSKLFPEKICRLFRTHTASYYLRKSDFLLPDFNTVTFGKHSIRYLCPKLWNKLPNKLRSSTSLSNFKDKIRLFVIGRGMPELPPM